MAYYSFQEKDAEENWVMDVHLSRIVVDPDVCAGRPHISGTTIEVATLLDALAQGATVEEILGDYPVLLPLDFQAAAAYSAQLIRQSFATPSP